jgi:hypothetical protein
MKVYLIILLIYFNCIVSQLSNNESLLVFYSFNKYVRGLFTAKFGKTINQIYENDSDLLVESHHWVSDIDYSLSANVILWREYGIYENIPFCSIYAIPINKR